MKVRSVGAVFAVLALAALASTPAWKTYASQEYNFRVEYPPGWHRLLNFGNGPPIGGTRYLDIVNFPRSQRREGVVIPPWGAEIQVSAWRSDHTLAYWIASDTAHLPPLVFRTVPGTPERDHGCGDLFEIRVRENMGSAASPEYMNLTYFYCQAGNTQLRLLLSYNSDNRGAKELDATALAVAKTIRMVGTGVAAYPTPGTR